MSPLPAAATARQLHCAIAARKRTEPRVAAELVVGHEPRCSGSACGGACAHDDAGHEGQRGADAGDSDPT